MNTITTIFFSLLTLTGFESCSSTKKSTIAAIDFSTNGYTAGTVVNKTGLDGCGYMIQLASGGCLEPLNLADTLQKDELKVWFKYTLQKEMASVCMYGEIIKIEDIKLRK